MSGVILFSEVQKDFSGEVAFEQRSKSVNETSWGHGIYQKQRKINAKPPIQD